MKHLTQPIASLLTPHTRPQKAGALSVNPATELDLKAVQETLKDFESYLLDAAPSANLFKSRVSGAVSEAQTGALLGGNIDPQTGKGLPPAGQFFHEQPFEAQTSTSSPASYITAAQNLVSDLVDRTNQNNQPVDGEKDQSQALFDSPLYQSLIGSTETHSPPGNERPLHQADALDNPVDMANQPQGQSAADGGSINKQPVEVNPNPVNLALSAEKPTADIHTRVLAAQTRKVSMFEAEQPQTAGLQQGDRSQYASTVTNLMPGSKDGLTMESAMSETASAYMQNQGNTQSLSKVKHPAESKSLTNHESSIQTVAASSQSTYSSALGPTALGSTSQMDIRHQSEFSAPTSDQTYAKTTDALIPRPQPGTTWPAQETKVGRHGGENAVPFTAEAVERPAELPLSAGAKVGQQASQNLDSSWATPVSRTASPLPSGPHGLPGEMMSGLDSLFTEEGAEVASFKEPAAISAARQGTQPAPLVNARIDLPVTHEGWNREFVMKVHSLAAANEQRVSLQLNPSELGSIEVSMTTERDSAKVHFVVQSAAARDALESSLPRLREVFEQSGMTLADTDVEHQSGQNGLAGQFHREQQADERGQSDTQADSNEPHNPDDTAEPTRIQGQLDHQVDFYI